jgi:hypothetical protein
MNLSQCPQFVLAKLTTLTDQVEHLAANADELERRLSWLYKANRGDVRIDRLQENQGLSFEAIAEKARALQAEAIALEKDVPAARLRANVEKAVLSSCRAWIESLPDVELEQVTPRNIAKGATIERVRNEMASVEAQVKEIERAPTPSRDLRQRIEKYIAKVGEFEFKVDGIGEGQELTVRWPDAQTLLAAFKGKELAALIYAAALRLAEHPLPPAQRPARLAACHEILERLQRVEEVLISQAVERGDHVIRRVQASPEAVLGCAVRIKDEVRRVPRRERVAAA